MRRRNGPAAGRAASQWVVQCNAMPAAALRCGISAHGSSRRSCSSSSSGEPQLRFRSSPARLSHRDRAPVVHGCNRCHAIAPRRHARGTPPYSRLVLAGIADYCARAVCRRVPLPLLPTPQRCALWPGLRVSGSAGFGLGPAECARNQAKAPVAHGGVQRSAASCRPRFGRNVDGARRCCMSIEQLLHERSELSVPELLSMTVQVTACQSARVRASACVRACMCEGLCIGVRVRMVRVPAGELASL